MDIIVQALGNYMLANFPIAATLFGILGTLLVIISAIDFMIPDEIDGGFSEKLFNLPVISNIVNFLLRFSLLRNKKKDE